MTLKSLMCVVFKILSVRMTLKICLGVYRTKKRVRCVPVQGMIVDLRYSVWGYVSLKRC